MGDGGGDDVGDGVADGCANIILNTNWLLLLLMIPGPLIIITNVALYDGGV